MNHRTRILLVLAGMVVLLCSTSPTPAHSSLRPSTAPLAAPAPGPVVWVGVEGAGTVVKVDLRRGEVLRRFRPGGGPHNIVVAEDGTVVAALYSSDSIAVVRHGRLRIMRLGGRPHDVKFRGRLLVVTNEDGRWIDLILFRGAPGRLRWTVPLPREPHDVAIEPGGDRAWISLNGDDRLAVLNLETRRVRYVRTGQRPHDLLFSPNGGLFVTDWDGELHRFSRKGKLLRTRSLGEEAHHLAFTPDGAQVWVTDHHEQAIFVLSARSLDMVDTISVPGAPHHVAITPNGRRAVVADHTNGLLRVYDVASRRQIKTISVGPGPHGVWAAPSAA